MLDTIRTYLASDAAKRAYRTFVIAFLAVLIPGALGWLHGLTEWAQTQGQEPFPEPTSLAYLGVSAITAGVVAAVNLAWNAVEDTTGKRMLR